MTGTTLRSRAMAGETLLGAMVFEFFSPGIAQILKLAGCEYVLYDMEHTGAGLETIKTQVACCRGLGIAPMVRRRVEEEYLLLAAVVLASLGGLCGLLLDGLPGQAMLAFGVAVLEPIWWPSTIATSPWPSPRARSR